MLPHKHVAISTLVGAVAWWQFGSPTALGVALASGVLPDLDHAVDYAYYHWRGEHRLILPLHGYEYAIAAAALAWVQQNPIVGVAAVSYLIHLLADQTENSTKRLGYSLLFRAWHSFRLDRISTVPEAAARGREDDLRMLRKLPQRLGLGRTK